MVLKRLFEREGEEEDGSFALQSKRPRPLFNIMREVVVAQSMQRHLSKLEPFIRRVVQEEVQSSLYRYVHSAPRLPIDRFPLAVTRPYRLHFQNKFPNTLFTGSRIEAECKIPVQIVIIDNNSNEIIISGPLSTTKIEILVLDGDFGDGREEWTEEEFSDGVVREREGKRPLLTGERVITLNNGVGDLADATFTDNSSWIRSRKFRLGARVCQNRCTDGRVHEAITEAFLVKDHRGELYKKHHPPALFDEVWRLEKIGKDGAFHRRLVERGINTVQDFLRLLALDQNELRNLLGMSNKIWEATLEHARECVLDDKIYSYYSGQGVTLLFDSIFKLIGARFNHVYHPLDALTASQKVLVNNLKELAYKYPKDIVEFDDPLLVSSQRSLHMGDAVSFLEASSSDPCNRELPVIHKDKPFPSISADEPATQLGFQHQPHAPSNELLEYPSQLRDIFLPSQHFGSFRSSSFDIRDFIDAQLADFQTGGAVGSVEHLMGFDSEAGQLSSSPLPTLWDHGNLPHLPDTMAHSPSFSMGWDHGNGSMLASVGETIVPRLPSGMARISSGKWVKLMAALKWVGVSKRLAARKARLVDLGCPVGGSSMFADAHMGEWC